MDRISLSYFVDHDSHFTFSKIVVVFVTINNITLENLCLSKICDYVLDHESLFFHYIRYSCYRSLNHEIIIGKKPSRKIFTNEMRLLKNHLVGQLSNTTTRALYIYLRSFNHRPTKCISLSHTSIVVSESFSATEGDFCKVCFIWRNITNRVDCGADCSKIQ